MTKGQISNKAANVLSRHYISDPSLYNIEDIILLEGAYVKTGKIRGAQARIVVKGDKGIITISDDIQYQAKKRFVLAHELGHFMLHRNGVASFHTDNIDSFVQWQGERKEEVEANMFAACLLMPEDLFLQECGENDFNIELIEHLSTRFKASLLATSIRYTGLSDQPIATIFSVGGVVIWSSLNKEFPSMENPLVWVPKNIPVPQESMAHDIFNGQDLSGEVDEVDISYYFSEDRNFEYYEDWVFLETAIHIKDYNAVLTFIYPE